MSERDELAAAISTNLDSIFGTRDFGPATQDYKLADALLADNYRKPRTITTVEDLDGLPADSVVRDSLGFIYQKWAALDDPEVRWWFAVGDSRAHPTRRIALPVTVLHEPIPRHTKGTK